MSQVFKDKLDLDSKSRQSNSLDISNHSPIHPSFDSFYKIFIKYNLCARNWAYNSDQNSIASKVNGELNDLAALDSTVVKKKPGNVVWVTVWEPSAPSSGIERFSWGQPGLALWGDPITTRGYGGNNLLGQIRGFRSRDHTALIMVPFWLIAETAQLVDKIFPIIPTLIHFY